LYLFMNGFTEPTPRRQLACAEQGRSWALDTAGYCPRSTFLCVVKRDIDHARSARAPTSPRSTGFFATWDCTSRVRVRARGAGNLPRRQPPRAPRGPPQRKRPETAAAPAREHTRLRRGQTSGPEDAEALRGERPASLISGCGAQTAHLKIPALQPGAAKAPLEHGCQWHGRTGPRGGWHRGRPHGRLKPAPEALLGLGGQHYQRDTALRRGGGTAAA
jgi:hypothetical protein